MLIRISLKYSVSEIMRYLKRKSSLMVLNRHVNLNINKSPFPVSRIPALIQLGDKAEKNAKKQKNIFAINCKKISQQTN